MHERTGRSRLPPAGRHDDLLRMVQIEGEMRGGGITIGCFRFETTQHDLLEPFRQVGVNCTRWHRIHPQTLAQAGIGTRLAERQFARRQFVQHHADREQVAARIAAHADDLFGGHPRCRTDGLAGFLGEQIGIVRVAGESEIDQHGRAVGADHDVRRFQVEMAGILAMQVVRGECDGGTEFADRVDGERVGRVQETIERAAVDAFHHQIRVSGQVAGGDEAWDMRTGDGLQHLLLDFVTDDAAGPVAAEARSLHHHRKAGIGRAIGIGDGMDGTHAARMQAVADAEAVDDRAGREATHRPSASRFAAWSSTPARTMARIAASMS